MGRTIKLADTRWDRSEHLRMSIDSGGVFHNCTTVLIFAIGRSKASISNDLA